MKPFAAMRMRKAVDSDPHWASVVSLLHFDGADGSTSFLDEVSGVTWAASDGAPTIRTDQSKFGGASGYFGRAPVDAIQCGQSTVGSFGTRDFTVEGWIFPTSYPGSGKYWFAITKDTASPTAQRGWQIHISGDNSNRLSASVFVGGLPAGIVNVLSAAPPPLNAWTYVAMVRSGNTLYFFVNGVLEGTAALPPTGNIGDAASNAYVGRIGGVANSNYAWPGYIDEVRLTDGVGRYTASFSPPTAPFPNS